MRNEETWQFLGTVAGDPVSLARVTLRREAAPDVLWEKYVTAVEDALQAINAESYAGLPRVE